MVCLVISIDYRDCLVILRPARIVTHDGRGCIWLPAWTVERKGTSGNCGNRVNFEKSRETGLERMEENLA
jgi:hypothetical protein